MAEPTRSKILKSWDSSPHIRVHICVSLHSDLHSFASKSTSAPPHTVSSSTSSWTKYLTSNSKVVASKPSTQFHPRQVCFEDLVSAQACIWAVR